MSVFSRVVLAGLVCASVAVVQAAPTVALAKETDGGNTGGRLMHATKCLTTFGFGRDCDKDESVAKESHPDKAAEVTKVSTNTGSGAQLLHASKCVTTFGFGSGCDKKQPYGTAENPRQSEPAGPDNSTHGRFMQAAKCVTSFGLRSGCDKKD